jgi:hypothetical protein
MKTQILHVWLHMRRCFHSRGFDVQAAKHSNLYSLLATWILCAALMTGLLRCLQWHQEKADLETVTQADPEARTVTTSQTAGLFDKTLSIPKITIGDASKFAHSLNMSNTSASGMIGNAEPLLSTEFFV